MLSHKEKEKCTKIFNHLGEEKLVVMCREACGELVKALKDESGQEIIAEKVALVQILLDQAGQLFNAEREDPVFLIDHKEMVTVEMMTWLQTAHEGEEMWDTIEWIFDDGFFVMARRWLDRWLLHNLDLLQLTRKHIPLLIYQASRGSK